MTPKIYNDLHPCRPEFLVKLLLSSKFYVFGSNNRVMCMFLVSKIVMNLKNLLPCHKNAAKMFLNISEEPCH